MSPTSTPYEVSVVVPMKNGSLDLADLFVCLENQTYKHEHFEVVIVDNLSDDNSFAIAKSLAASSKLSVSVLQESRFRSSYAARNSGIKHSAGSILVFTDVDCRPKPEWLEKLVAAFDQESIGIAVGGVESLIGTSIVERYSARRKLLSQNFTLENEFCPFGQTANLAIRRAALENVGLFRPCMPGGGDADLCWRILKNTEWKMQYIDLATVLHRHRKSLFGLCEQFARYGTSFRRLHSLHGSPLEKGPSFGQFLYRILRWLLKELPSFRPSVILDLDQLVVLCTTPLTLVAELSFAYGQATAKLEDGMKDIEWLDSETVDHHSFFRIKC